MNRLPHLRRIAAALLTLAFVAPTAALAQSDDGIVQIQGRVSTFDGAFGLVVRDDKGYLDNVALHPGTIINPVGLTLAPGMVVSVIGYNDGPSIGANEIDTPYTVYGGTPFFEGHPWTYFGIGVGLGVFFASLAWWHGGDFHGGYRVVDGRRYWNHVDRERLFHGGVFRGHEYVADVRHGGWSGHGDPRVVHEVAHGSFVEHHAVVEHGPVERARPGIDARANFAGHPEAVAHPSVGRPSAYGRPAAFGRPVPAPRTAIVAKPAPVVHHTEPEKHKK
jgi:hypothetical protein